MNRGEGPRTGGEPDPGLIDTEGSGTGPLEPDSLFMEAPKARGGAGDLPPGGPPAPRPPQPGRVRRRGIIAALVVVVCLAAGLAVAYMWRSGEDTTGAGGPSTTVTTVPTAGTSSTEGPGIWRERQVFYYGWSTAVGASDELVVTSGGGGLIGYLGSTNEPYALSSVPYPEFDVADFAVVWSEVESGEGGQGGTGGGQSSTLYRRTPPESATLTIAAGEGLIVRPREASGWIAWAKPGSAAGQAPAAQWHHQQIYIVKDSFVADPIAVASATELLQESLVPWTFDLDPPYVAWQQDVAADDLEVGSYVLDTESGDRTFLGDDAVSPSLAGGRAAVASLDGLVVYDLATGHRQLIDPLGVRPSLADWYVAYMRPIERSADGSHEVVVRELSGDHEWVLGEIPGELWFNPGPQASQAHVSFVGRDSQARVFDFVP